MVSNLRSARQAIKAELAHAMQGMAFYTSRVEALESALEQLDNVEDTGASSNGKQSRAKSADQKTAGARRGPKPRAAEAASTKASAKQKVAGKKRGAKTKSAAGANGAGELPATGGDFWLNLITEEPQSAAEISNAAISALGFTPNKKQITKLKQRATPTLNTLVAAQKIKDTGAGRDRRFFKTAQ
jgi:hypothetical protein